MVRPTFPHSQLFVVLVFAGALSAAPGAGCGQERRPRKSYSCRRPEAMIRSFCCHRRRRTIRRKTRWNLPNCIASRTRTPRRSWPRRSTTAKPKMPPSLKKPWGQGFTLKAYPATAKLMADVRNDEKRSRCGCQEVFQTIAALGRRSLARELFAVGKAEIVLSGSGHTTMAFSMAVVLASLAPAKAQALLADAEDLRTTAASVCEQHWRHDLEAGQAYGTAVGQALHIMPTFARTMTSPWPNCARATSFPEPRSRLNNVAAFFRQTNTCHEKRTRLSPIRFVLKT